MVSLSNGNHREPVGEPKEQELNHDPDKGDNWWLVALEVGAFNMAVPEVNALVEFEPSEAQQELLTEYEQVYDQFNEVYHKLLESFGFKPRY